MMNFVDNGIDLEVLNKSYESMPLEQQEELAKALKKDGLVLVYVQVKGKHGTYTRGQWKKASDVKKDEEKSSKGAKDAANSNDMNPKHKTEKDHSKDSFSEFLDWAKTDRKASYLLDRIEEAHANDNRISEGRDEQVWIQDLKEYSGYDYLKSDKDTRRPKPGVISGHWPSELKSILHYHDLELDSAYSKNVSDGEEVIMHDTKDKSTYTAKVKVNHNGRIQLRNIKKQSNKSDSKSLGVPKTKADIQSMLASGKSRNDIIELAKKSGISWKENGHEGINWMRCCMALTKASK